MNLEAPAVWNRRLGAGLLVSSLCLLALELTLSRIFSALMWHPFVFLVLTPALLGVTVSGLVVYLAPRRFPREEAPAWMGRSALALSLALLALWSFFLLLSRSPRLLSYMFAPLQGPQFDDFGAGALALPDGSQVLPLVVLCLVCSLPFVFGGFVATLALARYRDSANEVYARHLAGAGLGCVAASAVLSWFDPFATLAVLAFSAALAARLFFRESGARGGTFWALGLGALALVLAAASAHGGIVALKFVRGRHQPDLLLTRWNASSRIAVLPLSLAEAEASWGLSPNHRGRIPEQYGLVVDGSDVTTINRYRPGDDLSWARGHLLSLPYLLRDDARTLVIGPGGGTDILVALASGASAVRAVESNPLVVRAVQEDFRDFSGRPYTLPGVDKVVAGARGFLARDPGVYDVIQATASPGRLAPAAGALTFTEDHLTTIEAFQTFLDRLAPAGVVAFSRFNYGERFLRLIATARAALEARGVRNAPGCIFIAADSGRASVLVRSAPFTPEELDELQRRCRKLGFPVLYSPGGEGGSPIADLLRAPDAGSYLASLPHDVSPVGDDRPFFSSLMRPGDFLRRAVARATDFEDQSLLLMRDLFGALLGLVVLGVALPLALRGRAGEAPSGQAWASVGFFAATGLGFMVVEIGLLKRFLLLLDKPSSSLAVILPVFLVAGAVGSARTLRMAGNARHARRSCARLTIVLLLTAVLLPPLLDSLLVAPLWARLAATVAVTGPLGYLMGQPLPAGLSLLRQERLAPWLWSINGAFAVLGSVGALLLAANFDDTTMMLVGPACYLVAGSLADLVE